MNSVVADDAKQLQLPYNLRGKTVLITGVYGLIGGYLADVLCWVNDTTTGLPGGVIKIIGVDNGVAGLRRRVDHLIRRKDFTLIDRDLSEGSQFLIETEMPSLIFNCASIASPVFYRRFSLDTITVNVVGTHNVMELANKRGARVIHFSSSEIYGEPDVVPTPETYNGNVSLFGDRACYDESKRMGEVICYEAYKNQKVDVVVVRPFNIYGPGQRLDDGRIVPALMNAALNGVRFPVINGGTATRSYCYIRDAVAQLFWLVTNGEAGQVYNIGDESSEVSVSGMVQFMENVQPGFEKLVDQVKSVYVPGPSRRRPDMSKMPVKPQVGLVDGLRRTLESYNENRKSLLRSSA